MQLQNARRVLFPRTRIGIVCKICSMSRGFCTLVLVAQDVNKPSHSLLFQNSRGQTCTHACTHTHIHTHTHPPGSENALIGMELAHKAIVGVDTATNALHVFLGIGQWHLILLHHVGNHLHPTQTNRMNSNLLDYS